MLDLDFTRPTATILPILPAKFFACNLPILSADLLGRNTLLSLCACAIGYSRSSIGP